MLEVPTTLEKLLLLDTKILKQIFTKPKIYFEQLNKSSKMPL